METYGSIVMPSALCGVVGLKPTLGLTSRSGTIGIALTRDVIGPIARTVSDVATLLVDSWGSIRSTRRPGRATATPMATMGGSSIPTGSAVPGSGSGVGTLATTGSGRGRQASLPCSPTWAPRSSIRSTSPTGTSRSGTHRGDVPEFRTRSSATCPNSRTPASGRSRTWSRSTTPHRPRSSGGTTRSSSPERSTTCRSRTPATSVTCAGLEGSGARRSRFRCERTGWTPCSLRRSGDLADRPPRRGRPIQRERSRGTVQRRRVPAHHAPGRIRR